MTSPLLPESITEGDSVEEALENVRGALAAVIEIDQVTGRARPASLSHPGPGESGKEG